MQFGFSLPENDHMPGGKHGFFVSHGDRVGKTTFKNVTAHSRVSFMSAPVVVQSGVIDNDRIELWGEGTLVDGLTMKNNAFIDQWARASPIGKRRAMILIP